MGYTTFRNLHIATGTHSPQEVSIAFQAQFDMNKTGLQTYVSACKMFGGTLDFDGILPRTWYCEREEMLSFSRKFPSAIFIMSGAGEESCDIWERKYQNGRSSRRTKLATWGKWVDE